MSAYFEAVPGLPLDPTVVVIQCAESGADALLLDQGSLPPEFFDLSSGLAGELLHRLSIYHMRMAAVVPEPALYSSYFQAFVREANKGERFRFFATRGEAIDWIESE